MGFSQLDGCMCAKLTHRIKSYIKCCRVEKREGGEYHLETWISIAQLPCMHIVLYTIYKNQIKKINTRSNFLPFHHACFG